MDKLGRTSCASRPLNFCSTLYAHKVEEFVKLSISILGRQKAIPAGRETEGRDATAVETRDAAPRMADEKSKLEFFEDASGYNGWIVGFRRRIVRRHEGRGKRCCMSGWRQDVEGKIFDEDSFILII